MGHRDTPPEIRFHYSGSGGSGEHSAAEIAGFLERDRMGAHNVWLQGWPAWRPASGVKEIAALVAPLVATTPQSTSPVYHYAGPDGVPAMATAADVAARVRIRPGERHLVWRDGLATWLDAAEVPEIAALVAAGSPPALPR